MVLLLSMGLMRGELICNSFSNILSLWLLWLRYYVFLFLLVILSCLVLEKQFLICYALFLQLRKYFIRCLSYSPWDSQKYSILIPLYVSYMWRNWQISWFKLAWRQYAARWRSKDKNGSEKLGWRTKPEERYPSMQDIHPFLGRHCMNVKRRGVVVTIGQAGCK